MESVGFKEWAVVCEALGRGRQSVIIRKGGIAEGRSGFQFRHTEFFLFPTWFHGAADKIREVDFPIPSEPTGVVPIRYFAQVEECVSVRSWPALEALEPLHILGREIVRERFDYDNAAAVHVALVRVYRIEPPWELRDEGRYGGCRSWVDLPASPAKRKVAVLMEEEFQERRQSFRQALKAESTHGPIRPA